MEKREELLRLLYIALVEIRTEAYEIKNSKVFHTSDILHNLPLQLERAAKGEITYEEIINELYQKATEKKCEKVLNSLLENAKK